METSDTDGKKTCPLLAKEILFLSCIHGKSVTEPAILPYWTDEFQLDYDAVIKKLFTYRYLRVGSFRFCIVKYKVSYIKQVLIANRLSVTGTKKALASKILKALPKEKIEQFFPDKYFQITTLGEALLQQNPHISYFYQHKNKLQISIEYADRIKRQHMEYSNFDIAYFILTERLRQHIKKQNWRPFRNTLCSMSLMYYHIKDLDQELKMLLQICFMDNIVHQEPFNSEMLGRIEQICGYRGIDLNTLKSRYLQAAKDLPIPNLEVEVDAYAVLEGQLFL